MTARLVPTATEAEWLEARRAGVTASEIAVVLGLSPYSSPYALYHRKAGNLPEPEDTDEMALGRYLEKFVCDQFADRRPEFAVLGSGRELYARQSRPWQLATPDRLVYEWMKPDHGAEIAVLEAKTSASYDGWGEDGTDEIPVHYRCQVLWQMDVLGVDAGFVACLFLHSRQLRVYELAMDDQARADLELMHYEALIFLDRITRGVEPGIDWRPATGEALKQLHPDIEDRDVTISIALARRYQSACRNLAAAKNRKAKWENTIRAQLGSARRATDPDGEVVATRSVYEVREHTRAACTVNKLTPAREPS